jgi:ABC-type sugar transport system permease subunit
MANRALRAKAVIRTMLIWPYAVAPAISGILWLFLLHPSFGVVAFFLKRRFGIDWNPVLNGNDALVMVVLASAWKQISYNFVFFMAGHAGRSPFPDRGGRHGRRRAFSSFLGHHVSTAVAHAFLSSWS